MTVDDENVHLSFEELEGLDPSADEVVLTDIAYPFDPKLIKITVEQKTIDNLIQRIRHDEIDMNTEFQRKGNLWSEEQQSRLIESMLLRFPMPAFFFDAENDERWLVVDGLQRLWTFKKYLVDKSFPLKGLEILTEFSDKNITYDRLDRTMQRRLLETQITTYIIQPGTPKAVKYNVFRRINTGGLVLNSMEIRNALNQGVASKFLLRLSENNGFTKYIQMNNKRMEDRELILRAMAFIVYDSSAYSKPLSGFLDRAMERIATLPENMLKRYEESFYDSLRLSKQLFGKHLFSRSIGSQTRNRLNSALFEVWMAVFSKLTEVERDSIIKHRSEFLQSYRTLLLDETFVKSIVTSTSGKSAVDNRFAAISKLVNPYKHA